MTGRLITEYEPWVTGEMVSLPGIEFTETTFAEMTRVGHQLYVIEDDEGPAALLTFTIPERYNIMLGYAIWIRPELRGQTYLLDDIFNEAIELTGVVLMISRIAEYILEDGKQRGMLPLPHVRAGVPKFPGYYHEDLYIHAIPSK